MHDVHVSLDRKDDPGWGYEEDPAKPTLDELNSNQPL